MKSYKVYQMNGSDYKVMKQSFSWEAMVFGIFWMLYKKLWSKALLLIGLVIVVSLVSEQLIQYYPPAVGALFNMITIFIIWIWMGVSAKTWFDEKYGFGENVQNISANSKTEALWLASQKKNVKA